jgi:hypothetical protein
MLNRTSTPKPAHLSGQTDREAGSPIDLSAFTATRACSHKKAEKKETGGACRGDDCPNKCENNPRLPAVARVY